MSTEIDIEEKLSHLMRAVDDLSDVVARQEREIAVLTRQVQRLTERAEADAEGSITLTDQRPPHW
ncbi:SlyX family protein [Limimaricola hongkongensis]|uniref:SlyX protein n=1 Tax=Limimaricola hongkongensis DSM 17492 TaxID=1122180 RepID=A0A017H899_9RHOB|nr:SlyX family protein [Limimaricola hongkongensis]EYD70727.1 SlyX protein [Limimaricola hongkongensis DSM 17492]